jgi:hypothetical protein
VKKRRRRNLRDRVNHQRKAEKKAEARSELCLPDRNNPSNRENKQRNS